MRMRVADVQRLRAAQRLAVEVRAVGRARSSSTITSPCGTSRACARRGERVLEPDVGLLAAPEQRAVGEIIGGAGRAGPPRSPRAASAAPPSASGCSPAVAWCMPVASS